MTTNNRSDSVSDLRQAVAEGSFSLVFQPIVDLKNGNILHYEALTRFESGRSTYGAIVLAEEVGIVGEVDLATCESVVGMLSADSTEGRRAVDIAINLSGHSLQNESFLEKFDPLLESLPPTAGTVLIEVTETAEIRDLEGVNEVLQRFRAAGHPVCIDDFGTGSSVFHYLKAFDVDYVKIDRSFSQGVEADGVERSILNAILDLCQKHKARVIAEGVETERQAKLLAAAGVPYGQGYALGVPMVEIPNL